jgi:hypothetical protein
MAVSQRVQVTRAFRVGGEDIGVGSVIAIDLPSALELRTGNKVAFVPNDTPVSKKPLALVERRSNRAAQASIAELSAQVAHLTALVEKLSPAKPAAKEKANA